VIGCDLTPPTRTQTFEQKCSYLTVSNKRPSTLYSHNTPKSFSRGTRWYAFSRSTKHMYSGDSKGEAGWAMARPRFLHGPPFGPPSFFLISRLSSFGWHMHGCQMRFVKIPAILSTAIDLSCVVIRNKHRENRDNQYGQATINNLPYFGWFVTFPCVCVTWQSHQGLRQQQQINFAEETVLTRITTRVIMIWEILR